MLSADTEKKMRRGGFWRKQVGLQRKDEYRPKSAFDMGVLPELSEKIDGFWSDAGNFLLLRKQKNSPSSCCFARKRPQKLAGERLQADEKTARPEYGKNGAELRRKGKHENT